MRTPEACADEIISLLSAARDVGYIGEPVSQLEHALQAAELAQQTGADDELVIAALLHDLGHLCAPADARRMDEYGVDRHEEIAAEYLRVRGYSERVQGLVRGHVQAKRYLVAANPGYLERLSEASLQTLMWQGGPMTPDEVLAFRDDPLSNDILRLRVWDERAKQQPWPGPQLESYRPLLVKLAAAGQ